jgi:hypothetical protein
VTRLLSDVKVRVAAATAALVAVGLAGTLLAPPGPRRHDADVVQRVVVGRAAIGCPTLASARGTTSSVDAVAPLLPDDTPVAGGKQNPVALRGLDGSGDPLSSVGERGRIASAKQGASSIPVAIRITGPLAAGTTATTTSNADSGVNRGMASAPCTTPSAEFWFAGASSGPDRRDVLVLTNLDDSNASVDVTFLGSAGALDATAGRGIVVRAHSQTEVFLRTVAPSQRELALRVASTGGRVSAAVRDNVTSESQPAGVDWLQPSAEPSRTVIVPGVAPGPGQRVLTVANPGDLQTTVSVTVLGARGRYKPAGHATVSVPAGGVRSVRLDEEIDGEPAAIMLGADQPVFAAMRVIDSKSTEFSSVGSALPLTGPGYVVLPAHSEPATVQVSAPGERATANVALRTGTGDTALTRTVAMATGSTGTVTLPPSKTPTYVSVTPGEGGQVVAAVTLAPPSKGKEPDVRRVAAWPVTTSLVFRAQQGARPDVRAALAPDN